jgi:hypothetical protein
VKLLRWLPNKAFFALVRRLVKNPHAVPANKRPKS